MRVFPYGTELLLLPALTSLLMQGNRENADKARCHDGRADGYEKTSDTKPSWRGPPPTPEHGYKLANPKLRPTDLASSVLASPAARAARNAGTASFAPTAHICRWRPSRSTCDCQGTARHGPFRRLTGAAVGGTWSHVVPGQARARLRTAFSGIVMGILEPSARRFQY